jgi:hypothetical protein
VVEVLIEVAHEMAAQGGASRTVVIVVGSDRRLTFSVPNALARRSTAPVVMVPQPISSSRAIIPSARRRSLGTKWETSG